MINIRFALTAALLSVGSAAIVSAQQPAAPQSVQRHHAQRPDSARRMFGARRLRAQLFKGITLSDAEKANVKAIQAKYASQMKAVREQAKPELQAARDARQRGDTAALKNMWQKTATQREQAKQMLQSERNDLRAALTPANQTKFDANVAAFEKHVAQRAKNFAKHDGRRATGVAPATPPATR
jgi:F0F1-type ATP synthase membrane subunit b/b'